MFTFLHPAHLLRLTGSTPLIRAFDQLDRVLFHQHFTSQLGQFYSGFYPACIKSPWVLYLGWAEHVKWHFLHNFLFSHAILCPGFNRRNWLAIFTFFAHMCMYFVYLFDIDGENTFYCQTQTIMSLHNWMKRVSKSIKYTYTYMSSYDLLESSSSLSPPSVFAGIYEAR